MSVTLIEKLETCNSETTEINHLEENNLSKSIIDLSLSLEIRLKALEMYYQKEGGNNTVEVINKLAAIYEMNGTKILRQYLFAICENNILEPFLQGLIVTALYSYDNKDTFAYKAADYVFPRLGRNIGTPFKIEFIKMLMNNEDYKVKTKEYFNNLINDQELDCSYRLKTIATIIPTSDVKDSVFLEKQKKYLYFFKEALLSFIRNVKNDIRPRILSGQYILQILDLEPEYRNEVETVLLNFAQDEKVEYNSRADATDVLLQFATENNKNLAKKIIIQLGVGNKNVYTIYDNAQNVHSKEVSESVDKALEFLQAFELLKINMKPIDIEYVERKIFEIVENKEKREKIQVAFNRIIMDRALYSKYHCTLSHILLKIFTYLSGHDSETQIRNRLIEELIDMADTCSSGFASRLVNSISGFGDFNMKISWLDQIVANLTGRLNARIRDMDNLTLQEKILSEMTICSGNYELRKHFLKFFRANVSSIREEMYNEFKGLITDTDYDLYFRSAISMYEDGSMN